MKYAMRKFCRAAVLVVLFAGAAQALDLPSLDKPLWSGAYYNDAVPATGADKLHALGITGKGLTTAIIDSGFDTSHEIFADRTIVANYAEGATEHGNHVAGIAVSMAPDSDLWLANYETDWVTSGFVELFDDVKEGNKYNIVSVNNSWGYMRLYVETEEDAAWYFAENAALVKMLVDEGLAVVASSGNDTLNDFLTVPAGLPGVISVGALNQYGNIANFSSQAGVTLLAPGVGILSAGLDGEYWLDRGTSMAAPHVTGAITLLKSGARNASTEEIVAALYDSALPVEYDGDEIIRREYVPEDDYHPDDAHWLLNQLTGSEDLSDYTAWLGDVFIPHFNADEITADEWRTYRRLVTLAAYAYNDEKSKDRFLELMKMSGGLESKLEDQTFGYIQVDAAYRLLTSRRAALMAADAARAGSAHAGAMAGFSGALGATLDQNLADLFQSLDGQPGEVLARAARQLGPGWVASTLQSSVFGHLGLHSATERRLTQFRNRDQVEASVAAPEAVASLTLPDGWKPWAEGFGSYQRRTETRDASGWHGSFAGLMVGMEKDYGETLAGGFAAWANHNIRGDGQSKGNWGTLGLYGGLSRDEFSAGLSVSAGMGDYGLTRGVDGPAAALIGMNYNAIRVSAKSDSFAASLSARATVDWTLLDRDGWKISPGVEAAFAHTFMSGFTEHSGGGINLSVRRHGESYAEGGIGLRASKTFFRCGLPFLTASVKAAGLYGTSFGGSMSARFTAGGSSFSVTPEGIKSAWFVPEAALSWRATERVTVSASYQGRFGKHTVTNTGSLSIGLAW